MRHFDVRYRGRNILKRSFYHTEGIFLIISLIFIIGLCKDLKNVSNQTPVSTSSSVLSEKVCLFFVKFECFGTSETRSHFSPTIGKILHRQDWDSVSTEKINPGLIYPMIWPGFFFLAIGKHKPLAGLALKESFNV